MGGVRAIRFLGRAISRSPTATMQAVTVDDTSPEIDYLTGWYYQNTTTPDYNS